MRSPLQSTRSLVGRQSPRRILSVSAMLLTDLLAAGLCIGLEARRVPAGQAGLFYIGVSAVVLVAITLGLYGRRWHRRSPARLVAWAPITLALIAAGLALWGLDSDIPSLALSSLAGIALAVGLRFAYDAATLRVLGIDPDAERLLVVGSQDAAQTLLQALSDGRGKQMYTLGGTVPVDESSDLAAVVEDLRPTTIVVAGSDAAGLDVDRLLRVSRQYHLRLLFTGDDAAESFFLCVPGGKRLHFAVQSGYLRRRPYVVKRAADLVIALLAVVVLAPLLATVAIIIKCTSPGPAIYVSWRVGAGQKAFPCLKFRTMSADADRHQAELEQYNEADGCLFKMRRDPRVTRVGAWLRRTSIDELPQLINVLAGHMSLVGPRPLPLRDVSLLQEPDLYRHLVLPGVTGLWQISGRSSLTASEMLALDRDYIRTWSQRGDLAILAGTLGAVFTRRGAY
jgi:lipopolysaccharide/colanic/teichoic acid biosynthesis glycosyltransferase